LKSDSFVCCILFLIFIVHSHCRQSMPTLKHFIYTNLKSPSPHARLRHVRAHTRKINENHWNAVVAIRLRAAGQDGYNLPALSARAASLLLLLLPPPPPPSSAKNGFSNCFHAPQPLLNSLAVSSAASRARFKEDLSASCAGKCYNVSA